MKKIGYTICTLALIATPLFVLAQGSGGNPDPSGASGNTTSINVHIDNPFKGGNDLPSIVNTVMQNIVMPLAAVFTVLAIIYAGFKYVTAQGNASDIKAANEGLLYVLIGTLVLLGATGISAAIQGTICGPLIAC